MISKFEGIIIMETPYGDNSKIINVLTKEKGMIGIMCSNVKSIKNPLRTKTLKFTYGYFHINYNENKLSKRDRKLLEHHKAELLEQFRLEFQRNNIEQIKLYKELINK